jgi:hypothetical protein
MKAGRVILVPGCFALLGGENAEERGGGTGEGRYWPGNTHADGGGGKFCLDGKQFPVLPDERGMSAGDAV